MKKRFLDQMATSAGKFIVACPFFVAALWVATFNGWPEVFDLPSPSFKQIVGVSIVLAYAVS